MSINACTIDSTSIDGFCGTIRAKVFARLVEQKYGTVQPPAPPPIPGGGGWAGGLGPGAFPTPPRHDPFPFPPLPSENPYVTVTADLFGLKGQETLNKQTQDIFVTARNVDIEDADSITISVKGFEFEEDEEEITVNIRDLEID